MKAALISAFVFPGFGHLFLKKHVSCIVLAGIAFASLYMVLSELLESALGIAGEIQAGGGQIDMGAITNFVSKQAPGAEVQGLSVASTVLGMAWFIGIVDAYRVGRQQDKEKARGGK